MDSIGYPVDEEQQRPHDYLGIVVRRRWWLLAPLFSLGILGYGVSQVYPFLYESQALILVEQQRVPEQYVSANVVTSLQDRLDAMTQEILSRTRLQHIIEEFHLYRNERARLTMDEVIENMRKQIRVELLQGRARANDLTAFKIHYVADTPQVAQLIANRLTSLFIEENLRSRTQASIGTTNFLANELQSAREDLAKQEQQLREYKLRYLGELPEELQTNLQSLGVLESQLHAEENNLERAEQQRVYLRSMRDQYVALQKGLAQSENGDGLLPSRKQARLNELRQRVTAARLEYTSQYPEVIRLEAELAAAESQSKSSTFGFRTIDPSSSSSGVVERPEFVEVESRLKATNHEIEAAEKQISETNIQIQLVRKHLSTTPVREQQLSEVQRNYENARANYQSLLQKKTQSELATNLETRQQGEQFRIIDPATLPQKPDGITPFVISLGAVCAGFALGIGLIALREISDKTIRGNEDLSHHGTLHVIGLIPDMVTVREARRSRRMVLAEGVISALLLVLLAAGGLQSYFKG